MASRLASLYATLLGITVVLVIVASSSALVFDLAGFNFDVIIAKHQEARFLAQEYKAEGYSLAQAAPNIVKMLSGIGLRVAVYNTKGSFLAGDRTLRPSILDGVISGKEHLPTVHDMSGGAFRPAPLRPIEPIPPATSHAFEHMLYNQNPPGGPSLFGQLGPSALTPRPDRLALAAVDGGFVAFDASLPLLLTSLIPYWRVVITIAIVAIVISFFLGRLFARQSLAPLTDVTASLKALAAGDFTQRRFVTGSGDEIATLTGAYNEAVAGVAVAMDERRQVEERMRQFVADAGHELRTPLTVIAGYIDVLRRGAIEEPKVARQILGTMSLEKEHMRGLIDRLMRLARLDGEVAPKTEAIDVAELLRGQCEAAKRLDETCLIDYRVDSANTVHADRSELGEALWNVVENALKYAPGAAIHLQASTDAVATSIIVRDEGPGMTEAERLHVFERFYRGDQRGEITGSGLGLAIAKRAVERAGGTVSLDSAPGRGTVVKIRLPHQASHTLSVSQRF
ncbi:MAG TPA: HAMP domain-containing sensor histidine kinase [Verrucomicrobiae bacterium]|nr:HAMP domain-containing sensor histidine kinase [Verrucomicrobiae bacterium]